MKNASNSGFDQHYNVQVVVDHDRRLIVGNWLCDQPNDKQAALPTIRHRVASFGAIAESQFGHRLFPRRQHRWFGSAGD